jgi:hypothetical protein
MERGREKGLRRGWERGRWDGRRLGGLLLRVSHSMVVYACTKAAIINEGQ